MITVSALNRTIRRYWRGLTLLAAALLGLALSVSGYDDPFERSLQNARFAVYHERASGRLHVVELDAASVAAIHSWPWPRRNFATAVNRLHAAGARSIVFDVDFSSPSNADDDAIFAEAIRSAAGTVVLPTFGQSATADDDRRIDSLPIASFRPHAALAAVAIRADDDGFVRKAPIGTMTGGVPRPSLSSIIARRSGTADAEFPINYSIDPATLPRLSFINIRDGHFDAKAIAGKDVLIGATAIEIGDRYTVPRFGVLPGVLVQALATETLYRGHPIVAGGLLPLIVMLVVSAAAIRARSIVGLAAYAIGGSAGLFLIGVLAHTMWQIELDIVPGLIALLSATAVATAVRISGHLRQRRTHDPETGLPNRLALRDAVAGRTSVQIAAATVDGFDRLAAVLGSTAVADLVNRVADRARFASESATIFRVDDRVLAWLVDDEVAPEDRFETLSVLMLNPVEVGGRRVDVTLAMGFGESNAGDGDGALNDAMLAAAEANRAGAKWARHDGTNRTALEQELSLMGDLSTALSDGQIEVLYQPKLDIRSDTVTSVEALVRWRHPVRGYLRPDLFIPLAEKSDRIMDLTLLVIEMTMRDLKGWASIGHALTGAVNISAKLIGSSRFNTALDALLAHRIVPPEQLTFEVTESAALADPKAAAQALTTFRDMGIAISMDDYGTGQSTLSYIQQLPLSELKIDRSFVQFAQRNRSDGVLVRSTIEMAHQLDIKVVAEGVEDAECLDFLRSCDCDMAQGYLIGKPMSAEALRDMLSEPLKVPA